MKLKNPCWIYYCLTKTGKISILYFLLLLFNNNIIFPQIINIGQPVVSNFNIQNNIIHSKFLTVKQNKDGILYFGNLYGLIEFDGVNWHKFQLPNGVSCYSIEITNKNEIFIGGSNEIGYLRINDYGFEKYCSLVDLIPEKYRNFNDVLMIKEIDGNIIFCAQKGIFIYNHDTVKIIEPKTWFYNFFYANNSLYVQEKETGLMKLENGQLHASSIGGYFKNKRIDFILPYKGNGLLVGVSFDGIYQLNNNKFIKLNNPFSKYLNENKINTAIVSIDNNYIIGTSNDGIVVFNSKGQLLQHINKQKGLNDNNVSDLFIDDQNNVWATLEKGISKIDLFKPYSILNERVGIQGMGYCSILYNNILYLGTSNGIFYINWPISNYSKNNIQFKVVNNSYGLVNAFEIIDSTLFVAHDKGVFVLKNNKVKMLYEGTCAWSFIESPVNKDYIIGGTCSGLIVLKKDEHGNYYYRNTIQGFSESSRFIKFDKNNDIWISHGNKGMFKVKLSNKYDTIISSKLYNEENGLPWALHNTLLNIDDNILVGTKGYGIYIYNYENDLFKPYYYLNNIFNADSSYIQRLYSDKNKNIWFYIDYQLGVLKLLNSGNYRIEKNVLRKINSQMIGSSEHINPIDNNHVIIGSVIGFYLYDPILGEKSLMYNSVCKSFISQVKFSHKKKSIKYGRLYISEGKKIHDLPYKFNSVMFKMSSTDFENINDRIYLYYLEGYENDWQESNIPQKEYTNLHEGKYLFHLKTKNIYNIESNESTVTFRILPPWYRTILAYIVFFCSLLSIGFFLLLFIKRKLKKEKAKMEAQKNIEISLKKKN